MRECCLFSGRAVPFPGIGGPTVNTTVRSRAALAGAIQFRLPSRDSPSKSGRWAGRSETPAKHPDPVPNRSGRFRPSESLIWRGASRPYPAAALCIDNPTGLVGLRKARQSRQAAQQDARNKKPEPHGAIRRLGIRYVTATKSLSCTDISIIHPGTLGLV